uniref:FCP1 homology domain-containing protein n=1 Tax=Picea sitchensis TaxID=3332 RepID=D5AC02_PICSI|nr:unknown [Picea sitchensis]
MGSVIASSTHKFLSNPKIPLGIAISRTSPQRSIMSFTHSSSLPDVNISKGRKLPILLFDVMDTIVRDPFYEDVPFFFGLSMKELLGVKHPTAWIEFEKGIITEEELAIKFFSDGRAFDFDGLKQCMSNGYAYLDGIEDILRRLKLNGYEMHAFTNYPCWYLMIEEKLKLSTYLSWTFSSCETGKRKPEIEAYLEVSKHLGVPPSSCLFIDDRLANVEVASKLGMAGILFKNAYKLEQDLISRGIEAGSLQ